MVSLEGVLKKTRGKQLKGSGKWSHVDYVMIKICVMS